MQAAYGANYDPNHLLDELLRRLNLEDDAELAARLNVGEGFLKRIRRREISAGAALLIRINEKCGISVLELRGMLGDRRAQYRLEDPLPGPEATQGRSRALPTKESRARNDAGLPNTVQWT